MSLKNLRNHVSRNAFDLSERRCFTAKVGELLPVFTKEVLPGDKFDFKVQSFTRTQPVNTAAYTRIKEYYDYFFVPYRLLWRYSDNFFTMMQDNNNQFATAINNSSTSISEHHPYISSSDIRSYFNQLLSYTQNVNGSQCKNDFGFYRIELMCKLIKYLGLGLFHSTLSTTDSDGNRDFSKFSFSLPSTVNINAFPFLAYQKICQDYFRNSQWEKSNPTLWNVDYLSNSYKVPILDTITVALNEKDKKFNRNLFDLNYCNWNKDLFTGVLPSPQFGDNVTFGVTIPSELPFTDLSAYNLDVSGNYNSDSSTSIADGKYFAIENGEFYSNSGKLVLDAENFSSFSILALRQAEALQKWKEISLSGQQDYKDQIEKHFGVKVSPTRSNLCQWIGGTSDNLDITEVVNTNLATLNESNGSKADIAGKGVGALGGHESFEASEHGLIMCIYHAVPLLDYMDSVTNPLWLKSTPYDYAIPEFDSIGMQSLPSLCLSDQFNQIGNTPDVDPNFNRTDNQYNSLGYVPRYAEYKTAVDTVGGAFSDTLTYWTSAIGDSYFKEYLSAIQTNKKLTASFFKVNPSILDSIFAVNASASWNDDNLLINSFHDVRVVRNLDYNGLPY